MGNRNFEFDKEVIMSKTGIILIVAGFIVISFAIVCPLIIAEVHGIMWRIVIGLLGCFSLVSGICKTACRK